MLCVPTLLAFTLFHYEPPARIWSCSQPERQSNLTSTIQRANITSKTLAPAAYPSDNRTIRYNKLRKKERDIVYKLW